MAIPIYQVDAFTDAAFRGNPACVCILDQPKDADWMQSVAAEMNLSETAFLRGRTDGDFDLRWFTPSVEVELCGHATLATAHILWETGRLLRPEQARFHTLSGLLAADSQGNRIELDFPGNPPAAVEPPSGLLDALGIAATYVGQTRSDFLVEAESDSAVRGADPDLVWLTRLGVRGVMVTARSDEDRFDFVSRFFAPGAGIDEDPVTGSAHCALAPYWGEKLGENEMIGYQASKRGGVVHVKLSGDRVKLAGHAVTVLLGELVA
ncbi:PhzF family phenazine biosynthesis protein [Candidatus Bipolaricaulota bacterium]